MKFILAASSVRQIDEQTVEVDVVPEALIATLQDAAGDDYTSIRVSWTKAHRGEPATEECHLYNNAVRSTATFSTVDEALIDFLDNTGSAAYLRKAEKLREEAAELEQQAKQFDNRNVVT